MPAWTKISSTWTTRRIDLDRSRKWSHRESFAERLAELSRRTDAWRATVLGALGGAAIVIDWIELGIASVCNDREAP